MNSFYSPEELEAFGFAAIGENILISRKASFYGASDMRLGNHVRIDDFCILSGHITLGNHIHISAYTALYGANGITLEDHTGISPRTTLFSATDDFSGHFLIGPMHTEKQISVTGGPIRLEKFTQVGAHCVIMPGVTISEGSVVGAMSFVNTTLPPWGIYAGVPARLLKPRSRELLHLL